jgi:hypothetical protein
MRRAIPIGLVLLMVAAAPSAASPGSVEVRSVSVPSAATAGMPLEVKVKLARKGHARAGKLSFYLSANARRDRGDVRLEVAGGRPGIPSGQAPGTYRLIACASKSCRASRPLEVTATPVGTRDLLERDVAAGKLSPQQALVYRAFGAFGDRRLPARYEGDDAEPDDTVMRTVAQQWSQLSAAQRKQLSPFFLPPAAPGSWASRGAGAASTAPAAPAARCDSNQLANRDCSQTARRTRSRRTSRRFA